MNLLKLTRARLYHLNNRKYSSSYRSSQCIRQEFLDFFTDQNHHFVRSSSVIPFCDPTLSFCNAGMNQFKNILSGNQEAKYKRVVNSQKCIRVGGKHNDLSIVGTDSYHHTFFEMLGNWSFGDYFKMEACQMAWKLLTDIYRIPPERLYVTYFHGDKQMGLAPDSECKDIWRSIGVSEERLIGFGAKENFWEMGASGPCGGCSEIHVDHLPSFSDLNRAKHVNQDRSDLTELWNIVFIEHFRHADGSITKLPQRHIDTGMGFERLTAFLQNKSSNYDTDLFIPIFERIQELTGAPKYSGMFDGANFELDTAYRIIADHSRMIAVSLADGMFPEQNQKLRRILRKCITISEKDFNCDSLLPETVPVVAKILGETYPELNGNLSSILEIVKYEQDHYNYLRNSTSKELRSIINENPKYFDLDMYDYPGFVQGFQEFCRYKNLNSKVMSGDIMYQLYSTFGFDMELMERLAEIEGMSIDKAGFKSRMMEMKKSQSLKLVNDDLATELKDLAITSTNDYKKYEYSYDGEKYHVEPVKSKVISIIGHNGAISNTKTTSDSSVKIVVDQSPFYCEAGGQESDEGYITKTGCKLKLIALSNRKNCLFHEIETDHNVPIYVGDEISLHVDASKRTALIRNHSATHLLNAAIRNVTKSPIYQKSSIVTCEQLRIELAMFGPKIHQPEVDNLETLIRSIIKDSPLKMNVKMINSQDLHGESNVIMVPGEVYPDDGIRLVTFGDFSKELCCGTHALNTNDLMEFTFINVRSTGKNSYMFSATTGPSAVKALNIGDQLSQELKEINGQVTAQNFNEILAKTREISIKMNSVKEPVAYLKRLVCQQLMAEVKEKVKTESRSILNELLDIEMMDVVENSASYSHIIHFLSCSDLMKSVSLQKATRYIQDRPVLILSLTDEMIKARCCVPKNFVTDNFNAEKWLQSVSEVLKAQQSPPKGQNPAEVCNMKGKKITRESFDDLLNQAIIAADDFALKFN